MSSLDNLLRLLGNRRVVPPMPKMRVAVVGEEDFSETPAGRDLSSSWSAFMSYTDTSGNRTERRITCHQISGFGGAELVKAFCHERRALRSFRIDRMEELACVETGELFDPVAHFESLWLRGALNIEDKALTELARILVFLARCDGEYHPLEAEVLEDVFGRYLLRFGGGDHLLEAASTGAARLAPDAQDLVMAISRFAKAERGPALCRLVLEAGADMIDADGRHTDQEIAWAIELSDALKKVAMRQQ